MKLEGLVSVEPADGFAGARTALGGVAPRARDREQSYLSRFRLVGFESESEMVIYRTITAECGHSADVWSWEPALFSSSENVSNLLHALRDLGFDSVDVQVSKKANTTLRLLEGAGFKAMKSAYVYMPLQTLECQRTLKRAQRSTRPMTFRWATEVDVPAIVDLLSELIELAGVRRSHAELARLVEERMLQPDWSGGYLLIEEGHSVVGVTNVYLTAEREGLIFDLIIQDAFRRRGIGSAVWGQIGGQLQRSGFERVAGEVDIANPAALKFWLRTLGGLVDEERVSMTCSVSE